MNFIDLRELSTNDCRTIVEQSGVTWPADESHESRLFRFQVRRIINAAFVLGYQSAKKHDAAVAQIMQAFEAGEPKERCEDGGRY